MSFIGDYLWIWRADHVVLGPDETANYPHIFGNTEEHEYSARNGIVVTGNEVTICCVAVFDQSAKATNCIEE